MKYEAVSGGSWARQDSLNHRPDVWMFCKHQMLSNSRRVLWLTLGPHAYRVFSIYFITKTRLSWLFIHIVCTFIIYNLYVSGCYPEPSRVSADKVPFRGDGGWWQIALVFGWINLPSSLTLRFVRDLHEICIRFAWDLKYIGLRFVWDKDKDNLLTSLNNLGLGPLRVN